MIKKPFFSIGISDFYFKYGLADILSKNELIKISEPEIATFYIMEVLTNNDSKKIRVGDYIKSGERIFLHEKSDIYVTSSISGSVSSVNTVPSDHGFFYTAVSIRSGEDNSIDKSFMDVHKTPTLEIMKKFLQPSPGSLSIKYLANNVDSIKKIIVYGGDSDILVNNTLDIVLKNFSRFNDGMKILKKTTGIDKIFFVIPQNIIQNYSDHFEANLKIVPNIYPNAEPFFIFYKETGKIPMSDNINYSSDELCFIKSGSVLNIGKAFNEGVVPTRKIISIIGRDKVKYTVDVCIGTHLGHVLSELNISINDGDRVVFGGLLTGMCVYSLDYPILPDTEVIMIQDRKSISEYSNYSCTNCGSCVRVCPSNIQVNLLVRFLEAGQYRDGAELYDLFSCIECGLCTYVCSSNIPIFQYIKLAKHELDCIRYSEEVNE